MPVKSPSASSASSAAMAPAAAMLLPPPPPPARETGPRPANRSVEGVSPTQVEPIDSERDPPLPMGRGSSAPAPRIGAQRAGPSGRPVASFKETGGGGGHVGGVAGGVAGGAFPPRPPPVAHRPAALCPRPAAVARPDRHPCPAVSSAAPAAPAAPSPLPCPHLPQRPRGRALRRARGDTRTQGPVRRGGRGGCSSPVRAGLPLSPPLHRPHTPGSPRPVSPAAAPTPAPPQSNVRCVREPASPVSPGPPSPVFSYFPTPRVPPAPYTPQPGVPPAPPARCRPAPPARCSPRPQLGVPPASPAWCSPGFPSLLSPAHPAWCVPPARYPPSAPSSPQPSVSQPPQAHSHPSPNSSGRPEGLGKGVYWQHPAGEGTDRSCQPEPTHVRHSAGVPRDPTPPRGQSQCPAPDRSYSYSCIPVPGTSSVPSVAAGSLPAAGRGFKL